MREARSESENAVADDQPARVGAAPTGSLVRSLEAGLLSPSGALALQRLAGNGAVVELRRRGQQSATGGVRHVARKISDADLATKDAAAIMADETYIESNLTSIEFFSAELAVLHYKDGGTLRLGLVPEWIKAPVEGVDYRVTSHSRVAADPGKLVYIPGGGAKIMAMPDAMPFGEAVSRVSTTVTFKNDPASGRIVPTQVNSLTAPRLCATLRDAEAEYVKNVNALAEGGKKVMQSVELVVILASLLDAIPEGGAARASGAASGAAAAGARAEGRLLAFIRTILKGGTNTGQIAVEGVDIGGFEAAVQGERVWVRYSHIINTGRTAGYGRVVQSALERAAIAAAREVGAKTAEIGVTTIVNPAWQAYLESLGYVPELVQVAATQWTKVWIRTFSL